MEAAIVLDVMRVSYRNRGNMHFGYGSSGGRVITTRDGTKVTRDGANVLEAGPHHTL